MLNKQPVKENINNPCNKERNTFINKEKFLIKLGKSINRAIKCEYLNINSLILM